MYGEIPTTLPNGCTGFPECIEEPVICPQIKCVAIDCPYGLEPTKLANGCPGCGRCRKLSECPQVYCLPVVCPYGDRPGFL